MSIVRGVLRVARSEWRRLRAGRGVWLFTTLVGGAAALRVWLTHALEAAARSERLAAGRSLPASEDTGAGWAVWIDGWRSGLVVATLLELIFATGAWMLRARQPVKVP